MDGLAGGSVSERTDDFLWQVLPGKIASSSSHKTPCHFFIYYYLFDTIKF